MMCRNYFLGSLIFLLAVFSGRPPAYAEDVEGNEVLPFKVAGTVINSSEDSVLIKMIKTPEKDSIEIDSSEHWFHEGDSIQGFDIVKIDKDQVIFERDGQTLHVMVGYGHASKVDMAITDFSSSAETVRGKLVSPHTNVVPDFPASQDKEVQVKFIPAPENVENIRRQAQAFLDTLYRNPDFTRKAGILRTRLLQQKKDSQSTENNKPVELENPDHSGIASNNI